MSNRDDLFDDLLEDLLGAVDDYRGRKRQRHLSMDPFSARDIQTQDAVVAAAEALVHWGGTCEHCTRWVPVLDMPWHTDTPTAGPG